MCLECLRRRVPLLFVALFVVLGALLFGDLVVCRWSLKQVIYCDYIVCIIQVYFRYYTQVHVLQFGQQFKLTNTESLPTAAAYLCCC